jgi:hypothetical protein
VARLAAVAVGAARVTAARGVPVVARALHEAGAEQTEREGGRDEQRRTPARQILRVTRQVADVAVFETGGEAFELIGRLFDVLSDRVVLLIAQLLAALPDGLRDAAEAVDPSARRAAMRRSP